MRWPKSFVFLSMIGLAAMVTACGPEPFYDDEIGVAGVATELGSLAGTWAVHHRYSSLGFVPLLAQEIEAVRDEYFLLQRAWDDAEQSYRETWKMCEDINGESAGLTLETSEATIQGIFLIDTHGEVEHPSGAYSSNDALQLWALRNMPDPFTTPVPTPDNYQQSPYSDWIWDSDSDGHIGCTSFLHGIAEGEGYYIRRAVSDYRGVVLSPDRSIGLLAQRSSWSVLESTVLFAVQTGSIPSETTRSNPDPKRSWFEQIRLADDAGCAQVKQAREDQSLSKLRPF